ncbi:MAG: methylthioribulose-1-phosphate dehydratase [Lentimonas sp.]|jgi:methylthioribulose-1-phosphate dehydratase
MQEELKIQIAETVRNYNLKGWSPATSTNYSFRVAQEEDVIFVSKSGVDKSNFSANDFMEVDLEGNALPLFKNVKPSDETKIHCAIYELDKEAQVVLHSHSVYPVLLSLHQDKLLFKNYELQKGFPNCTSHLESIEVKVVPNSQNMQDIQKEMIKHVPSLLKMKCFVIKGHGTYAWGNSLFEAKRHLETLDYLCQAEWLKTR